MDKDGKPHKGEGHRRRLRERFLESGLAGFRDYEVVELLLTLATPRRDCKDAAKEALKTFGSLQAVMEADTADLVEIKGVGPVNVFGIKLIKAVADRYLERRLIDKDPVRNSRELYDYLCHRLADQGREHFQVVYLDAKNRILKTETLFAGTLTASSVYPREVVASAIRNRAAALIFAHNHPSGDPAPSEEDLAVTRELLFACKVVGIAVHEHIVVGDGKYYSFADRGHIARFNREYESQKKKLKEGGRTGF